MKHVAFWVFVAGVLISACYAAKLVPVEEGSGPDGAVTSMDRVTTWAADAGLPFGLGVILMVGGGVLGRRIQRLENAPKKDREDAADRAADDPEALIEKIHAKLAERRDGELADHVEASQQLLDEILEELVPQFLVHRQRMIAALGLERFAEMIGHFASMERNAGRAWSALTDGVPEEAEVSLVRARAGLDKARELYFGTAAASAG